MNKTFRKLTLPLLTLSMLAVSCGGTPTKSDRFQEESVVTLSTKEISTGSMSGYMIEIANDSYLEAGESFTCGYTPNLADTTIEVVSSRPESATIEMTGINSFKIITHEAGDTILTIYDADEIICFNKVVHVRTPYTAEKVLQAAAHNETYTSTGIYGNYRFGIDKCTTYEATAKLSGSEITAEKSDSVSFIMDYEEVATGGAFDGHFYRYSCTIEDPNNTFPDLIKEVYISKCAERILIYYAESSTSKEYYLLELFQPQFLKGE